MNQVMAGNGHGPAQPGQYRQVPQEHAVPVQALFETFEAQRDVNQAKLADLERKGLAMDPLSFVHARIDKLIDSIASFAGPEGPRWSVLARLAFEEHVAAELAEVEKQATRAQLAQAGQFTAAQIAQMARESGLFRRT